MTRIYVTEADTEHNDYDQWDTASRQPQRRAGFFTLESAHNWPGAKEWDGENRTDINTRDWTASQYLYRTAQGRWVLNVVSKWQGVGETYTYLEADDAREWLLFNSYDDDVKKHFGEIETERGGRPEIGGAVSLRLGDVLPKLDAYAKSADINRAEAARRLILRGLSG